MMNPKATLKVLHKDQIIQMNRIFAKAAENAMSDEYAYLQKVRSDYPTYAVTTRTIKRNGAQEHYKGLTYDFMRWYIKKVEGVNAAEVLKTFEDLIDISKCHSVSKRYPTIKARFLACYPEIADFGVFVTESQRQRLEVTMQGKVIEDEELDEECAISAAEFEKTA